METDQEKRDRKVRTEFYNNWAAGEHHNHGKQQDIETFEIQDNKNLSSGQDKGSTNDKKNLLK